MIYKIIIAYILAYILAAVGTAVVLFGTGCSSESREYKRFHEKYGRDSIRVCENGFLIEKKFLDKRATKPTEYLIDSQKCK